MARNKGGRGDYRGVREIVKYKRYYNKYKSYISIIFR